MTAQYLDSSLSPRLRSEDLLRKMSVNEKIGQLCKGRGFDAYSRNGTAITLNSDFVEQMHRRLFGTIYGVLRADWWPKRGFENGIPAEMARSARNLFQQLALESSRWKIPFLFVEEAPHGMMALDTTVFPASLGMGATFDAPLLEEIGKVMDGKAKRRASDRSTPRSWIWRWTPAGAGWKSVSRKIRFWSPNLPERW